jgi:hypothetical protein
VRGRNLSQECRLHLEEGLRRYAEARLGLRREAEAVGFTLASDALAPQEERIALERGPTPPRTDHQSTGKSRYWYGRHAGFWNSLASGPAGTG